MKDSTIKNELIITPEAKEAMEHIWFCADLHHSHDKIVNICGRPCSIPQHEEWLIKEVFNKYVQKRDTVYILGDLSFARKPDADRFIDRLNGNKFLILGNHDKNIEKSTRFSQITQIKDFTFSQFNLNIHIVLCHYCMLSYNRMIHGSWHLFGHTHCRPLEGQPKLSFDVGIDRIGFWRPYNLYEICKIMNGKELGYDEESILNSL
jgi:calcineurin-like phosphoesterase family protein